MLWVKSGPLYDAFQTNKQTNKQTKSILSFAKNLNNIKVRTCLNYTFTCFCMTCFNENLLSGYISELEPIARTLLKALTSKFTMGKY